MMVFVHSSQRNLYHCSKSSLKLNYLTTLLVISTKNVLHFKAQLDMCRNMLSFILHNVQYETRTSNN